MLKFLSLTLDNFGPYKTKQNIKFGLDDGITIVWGDNGRGKTILLNAFRYALFGKVYGRTAQQHSLANISNWESFDEGRYGFSVTLKMDLDGVAYELTRQFSVKEGISVPSSDNDYKEDVFLKKNTVFVSPDERDHILRTIMPEDVSRFFLFDGELLGEYEELLHDENEIGYKIKESIERILGVPVLINGHTDVQNVLKHYQNQLAISAKADEETEVLGSMLANYQEELAVYESEYESLKDKFEKVSAQKQKLEDEMNRTEKTRNLLHQLERTEDEIKEKTSQKEDMLKQMRISTKKAWQGMLRDRIRLLLEQLNDEISRLEAKRNQHLVSKQLMSELKGGIERNKCPVCEQELDRLQVAKLRQIIDTSQKDLAGLTEQEEQRLIEMQSRKANLTKFALGDFKEEVENIESTIASLNVTISDAERRRADLRKQLEGVDTVENISKNISKLGSDYGKCLQKETELNNALKDQEEKITNTRNAIKKLEDQLKTKGSSEELMRANKRTALCDKVMCIFAEGVDRYRDNLKKKVEKDASEIFVSIANEPEYSGLKINENYGLYIEHQSGRIIEIRSSGYEHIVALSLIGALHKNAPLQGPILMDSPFGRLDPLHKEKVTRSLPMLSDQIILLVYREEIDAQQARRILGSSLKHEYDLSRVSAMHTEILKMSGGVV